MKRAPKSRAFSLLEVLFAMFLVATSALVVAATMPVANLSRNKANLYQKAMGIAQKELESIRGLGYANVSASQLVTFQLIDSSTPTSANTYTFTNSDSAANDAPSKVLPSGTGTVMIEQADIDLRRVTVTVKWVDRGATKSFQVATLVANL